jgi:hypothetical protein
VFYSPENVLSSSGTHFCYRLGKFQGLMRPEGLDKLIKIHVLNHEVNKLGIKILFLISSLFYLVRFEVFTAVTEEWCLLGCYAVWLL